MNQTRRKASFLFYAFLALAGSSGLPIRFQEVTAFGTTSITNTNTNTNTGGNRITSTRTGSGSGSSCSSAFQVQVPSPVDVISRKAALVDTSHSDSTTTISSSTSSSTSSATTKGIRSRVNSFLRSKQQKQTKKNVFVQEVKDIDAIWNLLGQGQKDDVYTAVIFHAPYCRACKASLPLFEELAKQYKKQNSSNSNAIVKFLSVPVTQDNSKQLQDQFAVTKFPLAHIYDPVDGLVDERPVLRKLFRGFEERLESVITTTKKAVVVASSSSSSSFSIETETNATI